MGGEEIGYPSEGRQAAEDGGDVDGAGAGDGVGDATAAHLRG